MWQAGERFDKVAQEYSEDKAKGEYIAVYISALPTVLCSWREPWLDGQGIDGGKALSRHHELFDRIKCVVVGHRPSWPVLVCVFSSQRCQNPCMISEMR